MTELTIIRESLWTALCALYMRHVSEDEDDDVRFVRAYVKTWEAVVGLDGRDVADMRWRAFMLSLPFDQRSDVAPDGE